MNREEAKREILERISCKDYLEKSEKGNYCCPYSDCNSGNGPNKTGAVKFYEDTNTWYCHACRRGGDVIDLYRAKTGEGFSEALSYLAERLNINITNEPTAAHTSHSGGQECETADKREYTYTDTKDGENGREEAENADRDYTEYYKYCRELLAETPGAKEYLNSRGISIETAAAYWIGYDPAADPANAPGAIEAAQKLHPAPRLIIPTTRAHYIGRRIDGKTEFAKMNPAGSTPDIFNKKALYEQDAQEVFIVEGAFDALSIIEAGASAIALNSAGNGKMLLQALEDQSTAATLILCKDNDQDAKTAANISKEFEELRGGLQRLNISTISADINCGYKDANEALTGNRAAFIEAVKRAKKYAHDQAAARPDNTAYYIDALMQEEIGRFKDVIKTGYGNLDSEAGGLYPGLYILAAISSLGKTSYALQMADQIAEGGNDVIFFTLEQSRLELVTKSIARRMAQEDKKSGGNIAFTPTSLAIRRGIITDSLKPTIENYKAAVKDRLSIVEGNFTCDISFIGEYIRQYMRRNETRPVVFIDYLQILQPEEDAKRQTTREAIDNAVTQLKRISRELDLTIILISSVNRSNYLTPIDFESLKESGGIEYTADVVYGLQLECLNDELFDKQNKTKEKREKVKDGKKANPRKIELVCLKNRYGVSSFSCYYDYYPANDLFIERKAEEDLFKNAIRL